ncbi:MAG: hypothetical protein ACI4WM_03050 [Erysipelotrichaceae bacterium]
MEIIFKVKQKSLFNKKKLIIDDILALCDLHYGSYNENHIIKYGLTDKETVFYNPDIIARGFMVSIDSDNSVIFRLSLPACPQDIADCFSLIKETCTFLNTDTYYLNNSKKNINDTDTEIQNIMLNSQEYFDELSSKVLLNINDALYLYCAFNPLILGREDIAQIENINDLELYLNDIQSKYIVNGEALYYSYQNKSGGFGIYRVNEAAPTALPYRPVSPNGFTDEFYISLGNSIIRYADFLNSINKQKYDHERFWCVLNAKDINEISAEYSYDIAHKTYIKTEVYLSRIIIDSALWHEEKIKDKNLNTDRLNAYNHLAVFLRWSLENHIIADYYLEKVPELNKSDSDLRIVLDTNEAMPKVILLGYFKTEYQDFITSYYSFNSESGYPDDIDNYTYSVLKEDYNNPEYQDEAYLFMKYDEDYYKGLKKYIDSAFKEWKQALSDSHN